MNVCEEARERLLQGATVGRYTPESFGKDHWSLLAYLESCQVDPQGGAAVDPGDLWRPPKGIGRFEHRRMRCNVHRHPLLDQSPYLSARRWLPSYATVLEDGSQALHHDDFDALDDLEDAGLVEVLSLVNGLFVLTDWGRRVAHGLREHKARGGSFSTSFASALYEAAPEAAARLGIRVQLLRRAVRAGRVPGAFKGADGRYRIPRGSASLSASSRHKETMSEPPASTPATPAALSLTKAFGGGA